MSRNSPQSKPRANGNVRADSPLEKQFAGKWKGSCLRGGLLSAMFVYFTSLSWRCWPDLLVDFGHELYVPWRLIEGDVLYRDLFFTMGPLSQYVNATWFLVFGVSFETLFVANLILLGLITWMVYWLFRRCGTPWSSTFVTAFFLTVFAFGQYTGIGNYNYVCPYRHEMTHGLALGLAELMLLISYTDSRYRSRLIGAGLCLGAIALTKTELLLPAGAVAVTASLLLISPEETSLAHRLKGVLYRFATIGAVALLPIMIATMLLAIPLGWRDALKGVSCNIANSLNSTMTLQSDFYRSVSGSDRVAGNVRVALLSIAALMATGLSAACFDWCRSFFRRPAWSVVLVGIFGGMTAAQVVSPGDWIFISSGLPLLLLILIFLTAKSAWEEGADHPARLAACLIPVYGLMLLPKILFQARWVHYGFVLAMPGTLFMIHVVIHSIPKWINGRWKNGYDFRAICMGVFTTCALVQFLRWDRVYSLKTESIGSGSDQFYAGALIDDRVRPTLQILQFLQAKLKTSDTLAVIPDGSILNYLLRSRNPTGLLMFNPWEMDAYGGEAHLLESLQKSPPHYIVIFSMDLEIFGRGDFGEEGFGNLISNFIQTDYERVLTTANSDSEKVRRFEGAVYRLKASLGKN